MKATFIPNVQSHVKESHLSEFNEYSLQGPNYFCANNFASILSKGQVARVGNIVRTVM